MKKTGSENKALTASRSREGLRTLVSRLEKSAPVNAEKEATELYHRLRSLHPYQVPEMLLLKFAGLHPLKPKKKKRRSALHGPLNPLWV